MERALLRVRLKEQLYVEVEMLERLMCAVFGHKYFVEREFVGARKVGCTRCLMKWGMHDGTRSSVPWDEELEAFYSTDGVLEQALRTTPNAIAQGREPHRGEASPGAEGYATPATERTKT